MKNEKKEYDEQVKELLEQSSLIELLETLAIIYEGKRDQCYDTDERESTYHWAIANMIHRAIGELEEIYDDE